MRIHLCVVAFLVACSMNAAEPGVLVCPQGVVFCELPGSVAVCDPETGRVGTCLPSRDERHEGEPCELFEGGEWRRIPGDDLFYLGVSCLAPLPDGSFDYEPRDLEPRYSIPDGTMQCGTGAIVAVLDGCPTDVPFVGHDDPPAVPDENGCTPLTCESARRDCGIGLDGCGHYLDCGECVVASTVFYEGRIPIYAAAAAPSRAAVYVAVETGFSERSIRRLSREDLSEQARLDLPGVPVLELVVDDDAGVMFVRFVSYGETTLGLGVVDLDAWTLTMMDLGAPPVAPAVGPPTLEALGVSVVPGRPDLVAVYVGIPTWAPSAAPGRVGYPLGLSLYDRASGAQVFMPEPEPTAPAVRSVFPGEDGVVYAGLDQPLFLRRFEVQGDRIEVSSDYAPNAHVELSDLRWRNAIYVGGFIVDLAGVVVDAASGADVDALAFGQPSGYVGDPSGDRFYGGSFDGITSFDAASHSAIAYAGNPYPTSALLWLGDRRLARLRPRTDGRTWTPPYLLSVVRSDVVAP